MPLNLTWDLHHHHHHHQTVYFKKHINIKVNLHLPTYLPTQAFRCTATQVSLQFQVVATNGLALGGNSWNIIVPVIFLYQFVLYFISYCQIINIIVLYPPD